MNALKCDNPKCNSTFDLTCRIARNDEPCHHLKKGEVCPVCTTGHLSIEVTV